MPSHLFADRPAQPPEPGSVDALISQTRRLRGEVDAVRRDTVVDDDDAQGRWQRALCDLAVHHLDDLGEHLGQLKEGLPPAPETIVLPQSAPEAGPEAQTRVGSAEWNLLTDEVSWSDELFQIFGRSPEAGALPLDELGSTLFSEDQPLLTAWVTACLVDGKAIDGEFRIVRADGRVRTLHMRGEPVLDSDGCTASMWAVLRDVSELRRSQRAVRESRDSLQRQREIAQTEHRLAVELQEAVLPVARLPAVPAQQHGNTGRRRALPAVGDQRTDRRRLVRRPRTPRRTLDADGRRSDRARGDRHLRHGDDARRAARHGHGRHRAGPLMGWLNQLLETSVQPALGSAVCCRYDPARRVLSWAQAGHPAPLLFRRGSGRSLVPPEGVLLGATSGASYGQAEERLEVGDVLVLHTDGLTPRSIEFSRADGTERLLALAPRFSAARSAQDCVRMVIEEFGESEREDDACVLVARVGA